jgi:hypothetical protein
MVVGEDPSCAALGRGWVRVGAARDIIKTTKVVVWVPLNSSM